MSTVVIRKTLESALAAMPGVLRTALPNAQFDPVVGQPHQEVHILPAETLNETIGGTFKREMGIFRVTLCYPLKKGTADADAMADKLLAHFKRATTYMAGPIRVFVFKHPFVGIGRPDDDRWRLPVSIPYLADVP